MKSIVLELQKLSTDDNVLITTLLRKALIVASKLNLSDFKKWIRKELDGYSKTKDIPDYRHVSGEIKAWNPYNGIWMPFIWEDAPEGLTNRAIGQSIGEIEDINKNKKQNGILQIPFSQKQAGILIRVSGALTPPTLIIPNSCLAGVIDAVRNVILEWSLKLESEGILGEDMTFSKKEKEKATSNPKINIENFQGILGNVINSTVIQDMNLLVKKNDLNSLLEFLHSQGINKKNLEELKKALGKDPKPKNKNNLGEKVSQWIGEMVQKAALGSWKIGLATSGNILANAICAYYGIN